MSDPLQLDDWGGTGPVLHLAHANGFPPGSYRKLITEAPNGGFRLTIPRAWEARIFETSPNRVWRRLRSVEVPTLVLRGSDSDTLTPKALARTRRTLPGVHAEELPGTHLFPMEHPEECGRRLLAFLDAVGEWPPASGQLSTRRSPAREAG